MIESAEIVGNYTERQLIGLKFRLSRALMKNIYSKHKILDNFSQKDVAQFLNVTYNDIANLERGNGLLTNYNALILMYRSLGIHLTFFFDPISYVNNVIQVPFTPKEGANYKKLSYKITVKYEPSFKSTDEPKNPVPDVSEFLVGAKVIDTIQKTEDYLIVEDVDTEPQDIIFNKALEIIENAHRLSSKM